MAASLSGLGLLQGDEAGAMHFECRDVGARCKSKDQCCSGICRGKDRKRCRAHHTSICKTTQDTCLAEENLPENECGTTNSGGKCYCHVTTGGALFCAQSWACGPCKKDSEAVAETGVAGSACVDCPSCTGTNNP